MAIALIAGIPLLAQGPGREPSTLAFEAASVKPGDPSINNVNIRNAPGGRFTAVNVSLQMLIRAAFQVQNNQIVGGPNWLNSDTFSIVAKTDGEPPAARPGEIEPMMLLLQNLLADRFRLALHKETRDAPIYGLTASGGSRLGPQIHPAANDCGADQVKPTAGQRPRCGGVTIGPGSLPGGGFAMKLTGGDITLSRLSQILSEFAGRQVVDQTGLTGTFDVDLTWTPDQIPGLKSGAPEPPRDDPGGLSLFTAIQEQLGLKLEARRGPVEVLVIDRAERPTPD